MKTPKTGLKLRNSSENRVTNEFPIVGIGASAGGLDPIRKLLEDLPVDTGMSFVVIQHLAPGQESMLPEILSRSTKMKVQQVTDGMQIEKNQVYVITPGTTMTLKNGYLKLVPKGSALKPINDFLISLSSERKAQAIGIVLSGTGNDGTEGLKAIKVEGGITFVQDPETAQYADMPKNAIAAETAYFVLSPENIAKELVRLGKNPQLARTQSEAHSKAEVETDIKKILMMLKTSSGIDFTHYKETTINRRIARRMVINKIENKKEYVAFLRAHPNELLALFDDLLIGVTSFFREPKTFEALAEKVFPELIKNRSANESIRVWVPGCSTGEEVYSVAIAIQEFIEEKVKPEIRIQIFGSDANERNIEKARQGIYPKTIEDNVSENRLRRFFSRQNVNYEISKLIRDMCIFAKQDITNDPPFSNLDLIMCRNVMIYFDSLLHERVFPIFHYGLKTNGFLVLGESESVGKFQYLFEPVTTKGLIYKKKQTQPQAPLRTETFVPYVFQRNSEKQPDKPNSMALLKEEVDRLLMAEYVPATLLVNNNLDILFFRGQVNPYLTHEPGTASLNVTKIVQKELRTNVQTAVYLARKENKTLKETVQFKNEQKTVTIQVKPLKALDHEEPFFLITLEEQASQGDKSRLEVKSATGPVEKENAKDRQIKSLKGELESTKQSLQTIIEVQEATNEELRSTMEEAQSSNEELQSTNEELETAKEELQSGNEELQTLNEELKNRNQALGRLNDDLTNLQTNIDMPVIIVDSELKIRRFTVSAQKFLKISPSDVGRSITDLTRSAHRVDLGKTISDVINRLTPVTQEVAFGEDRLCEMQVRPYLTEEKKIDGAVLSFIDITERKKYEALLLAKERELSLIYTNVPEVLFFLSVEPESIFRFISVSKSFWAATGLLENQVVGKTVQEIIPELSLKLVLEKYAEAIRERKMVRWEEVSDYPSGRKYADVAVTPFFDSNGRCTNLIGSVHDGTERKKAELKLEEYQKNLEKLIEERTKQLKDSERLAAIGATASMVGHDIRNPLQAITSDVYLAKTDLTSIPESEEKKNALESLDEIEKNVSYINKIVADLQDYSKPIAPRFEETNLERIIHSVIAILQIPENVTVTHSIGKDFPELKTDQSYIQRILTNLSNNAIQAMPNGGKLSIAATAKNGKATITVQDTGEGIPENIRNKIFMPLMTTKAKGQGFGLSVVKRFTEAMGGTVAFESEVGKGTKFIIELPI